MIGKPYFVVERTDWGRPHWLAWSETRRTDPTWHSDIHKADRFETPEAAEMVLTRLRHYWGIARDGFGHVAVTEHIDHAAG